MARGVIARQQGRGLAELAAAAGTPLVAGSSLKAALDLDWDDPAAHDQTLVLVLDSLDQFEAWLEGQPEGLAAQPAVLTSLAAAAQVREQDVVLSERGTPTLRDGVAPDRRMSLEDSQMRHGRKSRSQLVDGYKRHVLRDLDSGLVPAVGITPANVPEAQVTDSISLDLHVQALTLRELPIDRAYLSSHLVRERVETLAISCRAWPVQHGAQVAKTAAFVLDWEQGTIQCPDGVVIPFTAGSNVVFPADRCGGCALCPGCTTSKTGRSVSIHRDERLMQELRERQLPPQGRAKLRERVPVEHSLAHIGHWQGDRARYRGERKKLCDLRRTAVVHNLHVIARAPAMANAA
jgi:IS5 family transposase/Pyruvate/2-oxoacid:ferredoxin oxidoreductase delta subunit